MWYSSYGNQCFQTLFLVSANSCGIENLCLILKVLLFMQEQLVPMSPMSMDAYGGTPRHGYHRTLTHTPSMDRRSASPSVLQHRVVAERKWVLGVQVILLLIDFRSLEFFGAGISDALIVFNRFVFFPSVSYVTG